MGRFKMSKDNYNDEQLTEQEAVIIKKELKSIHRFLIAFVVIFIFSSTFMIFDRIFNIKFNNTILYFIISGIILSVELIILTIIILKYLKLNKFLKHLEKK